MSRTQRLLAWLSLALVTLAVVLRPAEASAAIFVVGPRTTQLDQAGKGSFVLRSDVLAPVRVEVARVEGVGGAPLPGTLSVTPRVVTLPPRGAQTFDLKWDAPKDGQLFAHVVLRWEGKELVVPVQSGSERGDWLRFLPAGPLLLAVVAAWLSARSAQRSVRPGLAQLVGALALACSAALLAWALVRFSPAFDEGRGNDGLQLLSRTNAPWGTWLSAIDGPGLLGLLLVLALGAAAIAAGVAVHGALVLVAGATVALLSWDTTTLVLGLSLLVGGVALCIGQKGFGRTLLPSAVGVVLIGAALRALVAAAPSHVRTLPELARIDWVAQQGSATLLGQPLLQGAFVAVLVGISLLASAPSGSGAGVLATSVARLVAAVVAVRVLPFVLGPATQWAAPGLAWAGAALLVAAAVGALLARGDGVRLANALGVAQLGAVYVGLAACTPQGLAGVLLVSFGGALGTAGLGLVVDALERRLGSIDLRSLAGVFREAPVLAIALVVALLSACLAPGTLGFAGGSLALGGAFPLHRAALVLATVGYGAVGLVALRAGATALGGALPTHLVESPRLEPFGGHLPELRRDEALALFLVLGPAVVLAFGEVSLGFVEVAARQLLGDATRLGIR